MSEIKLLSFDLDDTLWDVEQVINRAEQELLSWFAQHYPRIAEEHTQDTLRAHRIDAWKRWPELSHDLTELRRRSLTLVAEQSGYSNFDPEPAFQHFIKWRNTVDFLPGVEQALDLLAQRYTLIALSNGNADIEMTGLNRWFKFGLSSMQVGHSKPHPAMFELACEKTGCAPANILHIGDDLRSDILGAQQCGMQTALVTSIQRSSYPELVVKPDYEFQDVSQLADFLLK